MASVPFRLESAFRPEDGGNGRLVLTLFNLGETAIEGFKLVYTSLTRVVEDGAVENARLTLRDANYHEFAAPDGFRLEPGAAWRFSAGGLQRAARHCTDGPKSAYLTLADGSHLPVSVSDMLLDGRTSEPPPRLLPEGRLDLPFAIQPWPKRMDATGEAGATFPTVLYPAEASALEDVRAVDGVLALFRRLFASGHAPFSLAADAQGRAIRFTSDTKLGREAYELRFAADVVELAYGDAAGRQYALTTLAQLLHGARSEPAKFGFPASGTIADAPRYEWRGCHLDVSRQFYPVADVSRFVDILAWLKLNILHWHLTDDEAWRLEIEAYPALTTLGVLRGPDEPLRPQLGNGAEPVGGFYSKADVRMLVAHAAGLHVEIVPEIEIPGHNAATLVALPDLTDGQEAPDSYRSVQGYANNALNPAIPLTYEFLEKVFDEVAELFPSRYVHVGGDEVAHGAWLASPLAKELMRKENLGGTFELQSYLLKRVKEMLTRRGKVLVGWNEVAHGGGVDPKDTILMAWEKPEVGIELAGQGYGVVMTPGQAYYLDMVQAEEWQEPGASWAGTVPPAHTYAYEAAGDLPEELRHLLKGVQACIWSEHFLSRGYFNRLVFPRLPAIAEAAWTPAENKSWERFAAIVPLSPVL
ncbi:beta-N-acetylhexosaminidase [Aureimonas leprariae]|uniref:beta-N-acetylhexosaminidase n=1 Tax=Plantimonas leprariae TaxID=2615207 RepID=A0A7V7PPS2_9HYPH|nr:family 20 glycosylhydrolase [Aureimonas leprariae]KAB0679997.1 beta-N-acetylhexosaminidase [Aureimonas leprariae]